VLRVGTLESTAASRLPPLLSRYHQKHPAVRVELTTGTTDALVEAVLNRKLEVAFVAECAPTDRLDVMPVFHEELVVVAPRSHPAIRCAEDVRADTVIAFPSGCTYRRRLQAWLGEGGIVPQKVLELGSYHAIVACVASGTGIALVPRSVLETIRWTGNIAVHPLAAKQGRITTRLIWRKGERSLALQALQLEIAELNGRSSSRPRASRARRKKR
jgi:DNA-binding transcriptional LysR family regulator